ncbi:MAG: HAD-IA family hydrolase [Planctomycetes bacterium]|nr:HAD-IA family hydrolase [Planctomycetota bacterium]
MTRLEGILIDAGGVLCRLHEEAVYAAWEAKTGLPGEKLRTELYDRGLKEEFDRGLKHPAGVALFLKYRFEIDLEKDDWRAIWNEAISIDPEMDKFARGLAVHLPVALASTTDKYHHAKMQAELTCFELFKGQAVSYEIGHIKPEIEFYRRAVEKLGTSPGKTLFIDDLEVNVQGAANAGLLALRFTGLEKLQEDLKAYGLLF